MTWVPEKKMENGVFTFAKDPPVSIVQNEEKLWGVSHPSQGLAVDMVPTTYRIGTQSRTQKTSCTIPVG